MDLFANSESEKNLRRPLAERMRPVSFQDFVGQSTLAGEESTLLKSVRESGFLPNLILWGPPGTGKTTFANLLSKETKSQFISCNAMETGAKELRQMGLEAQNRRRMYQENTLLFIDEIHRLNRSQQDVLLPFMEKGDLILIGATTENPSYELNQALLSRSRVIQFQQLSPEQLTEILEKAARKEKFELSEIITPEVQSKITLSANGDARQLLNIFEQCIELSFSQGKPVSLEDLERGQLLAKFPYDKTGESHYDTVSAFIKSVRGSDPDAAVYYLARMLEGGEDPVFIARRLVILASEDIGNADPKGLPLAIAALQAVELVGMPEARITLAQATTYLASAPKSNAAYMAINDALDVVKETGALPIPMHLRSSNTKLSKSLGYGQGYKYSHDFERGFSGQKHLPEQIQGREFYSPTEHGFEKQIKAYLKWLRGEKS